MSIMRLERREIAILPQKHRFGTLTWKTAHLVNTNTALLTRQMELQLPILVKKHSFVNYTLLTVANKVTCRKWKLLHKKFYGQIHFCRPIYQLGFMSLLKCRLGRLGFWCSKGQKLETHKTSKLKIREVSQNGFWNISWEATLPNFSVFLGEN